MKSESEITELMQKHESIARYVAGSFSGSLGKFLDYDDRLSLAREALWQAAIEFDPTREGAASFKTFAQRTIVNRFLREIQYWYTRNRSSRRPSRALLFARTSDLDAEAPSGGPLHQPSDEGALPDLLLQTAIDTEALKAALVQLRQRDRAVLEQRFWEGRKLAEIAADFGVTRERIRQIEARAVERIRSLMKVRPASPRKVAP